jgi:hypothetical protein
MHAGEFLDQGPSRSCWLGYKHMKHNMVVARGLVIGLVMGLVKRMNLRR